MAETQRLFRTGQPMRRQATVGDLAILAAIAAFLFIGVRLAFDAPAVITGPTITLCP
jgi:hypothetical protein